jgi:hypothetical protein
MSKRLPTAFETGEPNQHGASSEDDEHCDSSFEQPRHGITPYLDGLTRRTSATAARTSFVFTSSFIIYPSTLLYAGQQLAASSG